MSEEKIINKFFNEFINEATIGKIDCGIKYNIIFNTMILENDKCVLNLKAINDERLLIPTLYINNKELFSEKLIEYVKKAKAFYKNKQIENTDFDKTIMALLWSNATAEDFANPIAFVEKYIDFIDDKSFEKYNNGQYIGESEILNSQIYVEIKKESIYCETPYAFHISLVKFFDDKLLRYNLPIVRFGISNDKAYIYAIQNKKNNEQISEEELLYKKDINRLLYKVNKGLEVNDFNNNLSDVTPSFLLATNIAIGLFEKNGYNHIIAPALLITRWNAKEIMYKRKIDNLKDKDSIKLEMNKLQNEHLIIQKNISEKFVRNFERISYHADGIKIIRYPFQADSCAHIFNSEENIWNNNLLEESYNIATQKNIRTL